jgi:hypothetical protein
MKRRNKERAKSFGGGLGPELAEMFEDLLRAKIEDLK